MRASTCSVSPAGVPIFHPFALFFRDDPGDGGHEVPFVEIDELDPLRDTSRDPHLGRPRNG